MKGYWCQSGELTARLRHPPDKEFVQGNDPTMAKSPDSSPSDGLLDT